jgi:hypothetical protein
MFIYVWISVGWNEIYVCVYKIIFLWRFVSSCYITSICIYNMISLQRTIYILNGTFVRAMNQRPIKSKMQNSKEPFRNMSVLQPNVRYSTVVNLWCFMWLIFCRCWYVRLLRVSAQGNYWMILYMASHCATHTESNILFYTVN